MLGAIAATAAPAVAQAAVHFSPATNYAANFGPASVAVGDFNGDTRPDLATANVGNDTVSVLLGDGSGGFATATNFAVGDGPESIGVGDFNGDTRSDLATANARDDTVSVLLGTGNGGFGTATNFAAGDNPLSVAVGDFNGDTRLDLATADFIDGITAAPNVSVLLGDGSGGFGPATAFSADLGPISVAVGDFNGDTRPDLAVANRVSHDVSVLLGDGSGGFGPATNFALLAATEPQSVAVGDFNGDTRPDLAVADAGYDAVAVLLGNGSGGFSVAGNFNACCDPVSVAVGDFDDDSRADLVTANNTSDTVAVLLGNGSGGFGTNANFVVDEEPHEVAVGDFNGDTRLDLVTANANRFGTVSNVSVLLNTTFSQPFPRPSGATPLRVSLVPAFKKCTSSNSTHVAPLSNPSCTPPAQESSVLTTSIVGRGVASATLAAIPGDTGTPGDQADLSITASATDVLRKSDGGEYTGSVILTTSMRVTDRSSGANGDESATVQDAQFSVPINCVATPDPGTGGTCAVTTTADTLLPGFVKESKRTLISTFSIGILDAGADGSIAPASGGCPLTCGSGDEKAFLTQGVFAP